MPDDAGYQDVRNRGSVKEIKVGEELLEYVSELGAIEEKIREAYAGVIRCMENLYDEDTYQGEAAAEMDAFFMSLEANLQKIMSLYQVAAAYVAKVYTEMYHNDEQLAAWMVQELGGG